MELIEKLFEKFKNGNTYILKHLQELQADLEDLTDEDLLECRKVMLNRVNECLLVLEESNEDN
ncbi:hypothetical protein [Bacillus smithii]|uniref:hypothetical protein n=1 Tax=Bacillus smithii TaxID=1479 RepID=UPI002E24F269|nr:hypothetical protein [Bacillus smithii]MED4928241.1 hypothetical protein [Bacillus smithii]